MPLEPGAQRVRRGSILAVAFACAVLAALVRPAVGSADRPACAEAVLDDWTQGTLDSHYSPECYQAAIDALPEDLRAYTSAADDITRAAITAGRNANATRQLADVPVEAGDPSAFPTEVVVLVGLLLVTAAAGLAAALVRRGREE